MPGILPGTLRAVARDVGSGSRDLGGGSRDLGGGSRDLGGAGGNSDHAFRGASNPAQASRDFDRGSASRESMSRHGGGGGRGGGGGGRGGGGRR